ncbi:MAG: hypothetical protein SP1CHLAM54_11880 [Chlamydiia bacterium]|nr:hypothetical protein [Chlamydiia bacterium]MCH9616087.1 hypothetical protein [Chlamydiia bacterium]MCH9629490.1 hypothetical protein [Chlamydiia bacterium]
MLTAIISYCTHDARFLDLCLKEVRYFADEIIVCVSDHFFNGEEEDRGILNRHYHDHRDVKFIEFAFGELYGLFPRVEKADLIHYWHSTSRYLGSMYAEGDTFLFLDVDEIVDGARFSKWFKERGGMIEAAIHLLSHFYFREPQYRAKSVPSYALMMKQDALEPELILDPLERKGMFNTITGLKLDHAVGLDGEPLIHHYGWVHPKKELLCKVKRWGHHLDKPWAEKIEEEFSRPFSGKDSVFGLTYDEVTPVHDPLSVKVEPLEGDYSFPNVIKTTPQEVRKLSFLKI